MQHLISPLGISGPFAGAICAAAESLANRAKCPLPLWLDVLARPERHDGDFEGSQQSARAGRAQGLVPWTASGETAARRMCELSPVLQTRHAPGKLPAGSVDVHGKVHALIDAATSVESHYALPAAFEAWI